MQGHVFSERYESEPDTENVVNWMVAVCSCGWEQPESWKSNATTRQMHIQHQIDVLAYKGIKV